MNLNSLKKKLDTIEANQRKQRDQEHDTMILRYQNITKAQESLHTLDRVKFEHKANKKHIASTHSKNLDPPKS